LFSSFGLVRSLRQWDNSHAEISQVVKNRIRRLLSFKTFDSKVSVFKAGLCEFHRLKIRAWKWFTAKEFQTRNEIALQSKGELLLCRLELGKIQLRILRPNEKALYCSRSYCDLYFKTGVSCWRGFDRAYCACVLVTSRPDTIYIYMYMKNEYFYLWFLDILCFFESF